jgi:hypothetical protein
MKNYTKEELIEMVDSEENLSKLKELSNTNPEVKNILKEIKGESKSEGTLFDMLTRTLKVGLEIRSGNDDKMFEIIDQYLSMPVTISKKLTFENKQTIVELVGGFTSASTLSKEKLDILIDKMNKICNSSNQKIN